MNNTEVIYSTMTQPYTYQPSKNVFSRDGMVGWEQVDSTTWVWSIRPGMKFHNGDPVTSEDVAYSFGRLPELYTALGATHVTNTGFTFVDTFEATDELTVRENWLSPNADAPHLPRPPLLLLREQAHRRGGRATWRARSSWRTGP